MAQNRRPPADLDSGPVVHNLYVLVVGGDPSGPHDQKSRELTLAILKYVHDRLKVFTDMGVRVTVHKVKKIDLANPRLVAAMKAKMITSLPALVTPNDAYIGNRAIVEVYDKNIKVFEAWKRRETEDVAGMAPEDDLSAFYRDEMTFERAAQDDDLGDDEDKIGEGGDMMDSYRAMMQRRETRDARGRGGGARRGTAAAAPAPSKTAGRRAAPAPAAGRRGDNVPGGSADDLMDSLIDRMAGDIDAQTFETAFSAPGGDSLDDDGLDAGGNAQDDIMEKAYWSNQEMSM